MGELTHAEYGRADILAVGRWIDVRDHVIYVLDPATGEPLHPDQPPVWLAADPRLAEGYQALDNPEHAHELTIVLSKHNVGRDLGRFENRFTWFERTYAKSHAMAFEEGIKGWDRREWTYTLNKLRSFEQWPRGLAESTSFPDRLMRSALKHPHVAEFSYDIEKTGKPIDKLLLELVSPAVQSARLRHLNPPVRKALRFAAGALREWYIPGKYMHELLKLDLPDSPRALLTIGAGHGDVPRKFSVLGLTPRVRHSPLSSTDKEQVALHTQAMRVGYIDTMALGRLSLG